VILWREKFLAFALHFLVTLVLAAGAAALIFLVWFPDPFQNMLGGWKLFVLVVGCDLALGPLMSLVVYNSQKARKLLVLDYTIIGAIQLAALVYGIFVMSSSRPVYVAFVKDRFEVVVASDIAKADLQAAKDPYRSLPLWRPRLIATKPPTDPHERSALLFASVAGRDIQVQPRYYVSYESQLEEIRGRAQPLATLRAHRPDGSSLIAAAEQDLHVTEDGLRWLPVSYGRGFWTALIDAQSAQPLAYLPIDPF
jgi:hypothetical protein